MKKSNLLNIRYKRAFIIVSVLLLLLFGLGCSGGGGNKEASPPTTTPTPPATSSDRKIFVAHVFGNKITVFDADDSGNVAPIRSIGSNTELFTPSGIFVDTENNEIFVTNFENDTITVYRRTDTGDVSPLRFIGGPNTGLFGPVRIFVDTKNDEIFVVNLVIVPGEDLIEVLSSITVYGMTDEGNVSPRRIIAGPNTGYVIPVGIFVDLINEEILVANQAINNGILVYPRTANGDVPPLMILNISDLTDEGIPFLPTSIYLDTVNNEIFVANGDDINIPGEITVYERTDSGDVPPLRIISGENTGLFRPLGIFTDAQHDEIFVTNPFDDTVTIYGRTDNGNITPKRTIEGPNTELAIPWGIFVAESP